MRISVIVTDAEHKAIAEAAQDVPLTKFILRIVMNNLLADLPKGNLLGSEAERAKIKDQMRELVPTIPGKAAYDPEDKLPDFVADQPAEESGGSGNDQDVRRYEELPANQRGTPAGRRQVGRHARASARVGKRAGKSRTRPTGADHPRCTNAVAPGLYCPKCDRRH